MASVKLFLNWLRKVTEECRKKTNKIENLEYLWNDGEFSFQIYKYTAYTLRVETFAKKNNTFTSCRYLVHPMCQTNSYFYYSYWVPPQVHTFPKRRRKRPNICQRLLMLRYAPYCFLATSCRATGVRILVPWQFHITHKLECLQYVFNAIRTKNPSRKRGRWN